MVFKIYSYRYTYRYRLLQGMVIGFYIISVLTSCPYSPVIGLLSFIGRPKSSIVFFFRVLGICLHPWPSLRSVQYYAIHIRDPFIQPSIHTGLYALLYLYLPDIYLYLYIIHIVYNTYPIGSRRWFGINLSNTRLIKT